MADTFAEIPDREWFKASEVCDIAAVQPYVLRSWELEFPTLGVARTAGGPRTYRRADVERVLQIRQLVFVEGLTLAGTRRRIEGDEPSAADGPQPPVVDPGARQKLDAVKKDLRALLQILDGGKGGAAARTWPPHPQPSLLEFDGRPAAAEARAGSGNGRKPAAKKGPVRGKK